MTIIVGPVTAITPLTLTLMEMMPLTLTLMAGIVGQVAAMGDIQNVPDVYKEALSIIHHNFKPLAHVPCITATPTAYYPPPNPTSGRTISGNPRYMVAHDVMSTAH